MRKRVDIERIAEEQVEAIKRGIRALRYYEDVPFEVVFDDEDVRLAVETVMALPSAYRETFPACRTHGGTWLGASASYITSGLRSALKVAQDA